MTIRKWRKEDDDRLIALLNHGHGQHEIAKTLRLNVGVVSGRIHRLRKMRPNDLPAARSLSKKQISAKNMRNPDRKSVSFKNVCEQLEAKQPDILLPKPTNSPVPFHQLNNDQCSYCVEDLSEAPSHQMMCCGAPVMDPTAREGDRRRTHCSYHYELCVDRSPPALRQIRYSRSAPKEYGVSNVSD